MAAPESFNEKPASEFLGIPTPGSSSSGFAYTIYALSAQPLLSVSASQVDRSTLLKAIQNRTLASAELHVTYTRTQADGGGDSANTAGMTAPARGGTPPQSAIAACADKKEQTACEFTSQRGKETGVCELVQNQLACSPPKGAPNGK